MIKKLLILLLLSSAAWGQQTGIKPMLGTPFDISHPLSRGLVGRWLLNEGSGSKVYDVSGNGNHGTIMDSSWIPGLHGSALSMLSPVSGSYIDCGSKASVLPSGQFTFTAWCRNVNDSGDWCLFSLAQGTLPYFALNKTGGQPLLYVEGGTYRYWDATAGNIMGDYKWHHVVLIYTGNITTCQLYIDGKLMTPGATGGTTAINAKTGLWVGRTTGNFYYCNLDEFSLYNRILSASEVQQLYIDPFQMFKPSFDLYLMGGVVVPGVSGGQVIMIGEL